MNPGSPNRPFRHDHASATPISTTAVSAGYQAIRRVNRPPARIRASNVSSPNPPSTATPTVQKNNRRVGPRNGGSSV